MHALPTSSKVLYLALLRVGWTESTIKNTFTTDMVNFLSPLYEQFFRVIVFGGYIFTSHTWDHRTYPCNHSYVFLSFGSRSLKSGI